MFTPLSKEEIAQIVKILLTSLQKQLEQDDIILKYDAAVLEKIVEAGYDRQFGARPLKRYIQDTIEDLLAKKKLIVCFSLQKSALSAFLV